MPATPSWYFKGRKCCRCGSDTTFMDGGTSPKWRGCKCGNKDCSKWLCYDCFYEIGRSGRRKIKEDRLKNIKCRECGSCETYDGYWIRYKDKSDTWDEKSYVCSRCNSKKWYAETIGPMRKCRSENIYLKKFEDLSEREKGKIVEDVMAEEFGLETKMLYPIIIMFHVI